MVFYDVRNLFNFFIVGLFSRLHNAILQVRNEDLLILENSISKFSNAIAVHFSEDRIDFDANPFQFFPYFATAVD